MPSTMQPGAADAANPLAGLEHTLWATDPSWWPGFALRGGRMVSHADLDRPVSPSERLMLCTAGRAVFSNRRGPCLYDGAWQPGWFHIEQKGFEWDRVSWTGSIDFAEVNTDETQVSCLHDENRPEPPRLSMRFLMRDARMQSLLDGLVAEASAGNPGGRLYAEALSIALVAYARAHYAVASPPPSPHRSSRLTPTQERRVRDYIDAHLGAALGLRDLCALCDLGPQQFSTLFKTTVGQTPHRYVLEQRIERSKRLLGTGREPIASVAAQLGFADQSHFSNVFKKLTGRTPRQFVRSG